MSLTKDLDALRTQFAGMIPAEAQKLMAAEEEKLVALGLAKKAKSVGDTLPEFSLPNHLGENVSLSSLLGEGPLVISFYRGGWCPYCNLELKALQEALPEIKRLGAKLVAITPELPDASLTTKEKHSLAFPVLSDAKAEYAKTLGLVFTLPESLRPIYESFEINVEQHNGEGQFDLPIPATYIVDQEGKIVKAFIDEDYTSRMDPDAILKSLRLLTEVPA